MKRKVTLLTALLTLPAAAGAQPTDPDPWLGPDKALHFGVSAGLAMAGYGLASLGTEDTGRRLLAGAGLALAAGLGKEAWDLSGRGHASWKDLGWGVLGAATGLFLAWVIDRVLGPEGADAPQPVRH